MMHTTPKSASLLILVVSLCVVAFALTITPRSTVAAETNGEINLYSYRQAFLLEPLLDAFTRESGIKVNVVYAKQGLIQRLKAEGRNSPADAILTSDISRIFDLAEAGLLRPIKSDVLERNIPAAYRDADGLWFGLSSRARVIYAHKTRVKPGEVQSYEDLASEKFKGRVCTRSGKHPYNVGLLATIISALGETDARAWLQGLKDNLARKPQGNDRAQVKAIYEGQCDVSIGNSYYFGNMATNEKKPEEKAWAASVNVVFPNQSGDGALGRGAHINISTGAVTQSAKNVEGAQKLLEFLSDSFAQEIYAGQNFEFPLKSGTALHPIVKAWGDFKADTQHLRAIVTERIRATKMVDEVGFDQ